LEYLESRAAEHDDEEDDDDDGASDWSLDLMMQEDPFFVTVLDKVDAYNRFEELMTNLSSKPEVAAHLQQTVTPEKQSAIEGLLSKSRENREKAAAAAANKS
jgi:hypothetical protein